MDFLLSILLSTILLPASGIYNAYIAQGMERDLPKHETGLQAPVREGAKPIVIEAEKEKAVLMLHGFSGSPRDFGRLPRMFKDKGYDVFVPLLPAHGRGARAMAHVTAEEWLEYARKTYRQVRARYQEVVLIGLSMGGALSVIVSAENAGTPPDKLILLAPFFKVKQEWYYFLPIETYHKVLASWVPYVRSLPGQAAVSKGSTYSNSFVKHQYVATRAAGEAFEIAAMARRKVLEVRVPMLVIHSRNDKITDYPTTRKIIQSHPRKDSRLVTLERSNHVLPLDTEAFLVEEIIRDFVFTPEPAEETGPQMQDAGQGNGESGADK